MFHHKIHLRPNTPAGADPPRGPAAILFSKKAPKNVLVTKRLNSAGYINQMRLANSLGDKPGLGNP